MLGFGKLSELAKDRTKAGRTRFVSALADLFVSGDVERTEQCSFLFGQIVMDVLWQLEEETRIALAQRIGEHARAPRQLIKKLASDTIYVAEVPLKNSPVLTADDLVELADKVPMEHLEAIASRETVQEAVTSVLVERGDDAVLTKVAENHGASMADATFNRLVSKATALPELQAALVGRNDIPAEAATVLVDFLNEELAERVRSLGADSTLASVMAQRAADEVRARSAGLEQNRKDAFKLIEEVGKGQKQVDEVIRHFASYDAVAEIGMLLAKVSDLPLSAVSSLLYGKSDKALIIVCKAIGMSGDCFKTILMLRAKRVSLSGMDVIEALKRYEQFAQESALRSVEVIRESCVKPSAAEIEKAG